MPTVAEVNMEVGANHARIKKDLDKAGKTIEQFGKKSDRVSRRVGKQNNALRHSFGNLGHQVQDVAVQMQMGTDVMRVFTQQGSQIASAFGPSGAIIGGFLAVGGALAGALIPALVAGKKKAEALEKANRALGESFEISHGKVVALSNDLRALAVVDKDLAKLKFAVLIGQGATAAEGQVKAFKKTLDTELGGISTEIEDLYRLELKLKTATERRTGRGASVAALRRRTAEKSIAAIAKKYELSREAAERFVKAAGAFQTNKSVESAEELRKTLVEIGTAGNDALDDLALKLEGSIAGFLLSHDQVKGLKTDLAGIDSLMTDQTKAVIEALEEEMATRRMAGEALAVHTALKKLDAGASEEQKTKVEDLARANFKAAEAAKKKAEAEREAQNQAQQAAREQQQRLVAEERRHQQFVTALEKSAERVFAATRTPVEAYRLELERLAALEQQFKDNKIAFDADAFTRAQGQARSRLTTQLDGAKDKVVDFRAAFEHAFDFSQPLDELALDFGRTIARMLQQAVAADLANALFGGSGIFGASRKTAGAIEPLTSIARIPKFAAGGPVAANRPHLVGELGKELFVPHSSGTIVPNRLLADRGPSSPVTVTLVQNVEAGVNEAAVHEALAASLPAFRSTLINDTIRALERRRRT